MIGQFTSSYDAPTPFSPRHSVINSAIGLEKYTNALGISIGVIYWFSFIYLLLYNSVSNQITHGNKVQMCIMRWHYSFNYFILEIQHSVIHAIPNNSDLPIFCKIFWCLWTFFSQKYLEIVWNDLSMCLWRATRCDLGFRWTNCNSGKGCSGWHCFVSALWCHLHCHER